MAAGGPSEDFRRAIGLAGSGDHAGAAELFAAELKRHPSADAACNLAYCLRRLDRHDEARDALRRALEIDATHAGAMLNLGSLLIDRDDLAGAEAVMRKAAAAHPGDAAIRVNLASALFHQGRYDEAAAAAEAALAIQSDQPHAHHTLANIFLGQGRLKEGFEQYQWRIQCGTAALALDGDALGIPLWQGEDLTGKTLLAITEQGLGDTLHFVRYGALVRGRGGRMIVTCQPPLERLLAAAPCVDGLVRRGDPRPAADFHLPLLSLPYRFGTVAETIPDAIPYLTARPEWVAEWAGRLGERRRPRIALVWAGSPGHKNDRNRSLAASMLAPLVDGDWDCVTVQVGMRDSDRAWFAGRPEVRVLGDAIRDFADTAAILSQVDLLITVDTSVAHLAGALGVPCWVMLPWIPDWRWLIDGEDSAWYPSLRLFRQKTPGDWPAVIAALRAALPEFMDSLGRVVPLFQAAAAVHAQGDVAAARRDYHRILAVAPLHPETLHNLAMVDQQAGDLAAAERRLRRALAARPRYAAAHRSLAAVLAARGRHAEALPLWESALELRPGDAVVHDGLGRCLIELDLAERAVAVYREARRLFPDDPGLIAAEGAALASVPDWEAAAPVLTRAAALFPGRADVWSNLGTALKNTEDFEGAVNAFRRACEADPNLANAQWNLSLLLLLLGQCEEGWERYEWRWKVRGFPSPARQFPVPLWQGEALAGKRICVTWEQGFGDTIQFVRLLALLKARGAQLVFECQGPLYELFLGVPWVDLLVRAGDPLPMVDCHIPLLGIARVVGLDLNRPEASGLAPGPFLAADPAAVARWAERLGERRRLRVALAWAGSSGHRNDHNRSLPLPLLAPLLDGDWDCVAVQVELREADRAFLAGRPEVRVVGDGIRDFADTAAILAQVDVLIAVDTAVAHLGAALGVPTWVLMPAVPDWRWQLGRTDSAWYPSLRLFRQTRRGDWTDVVGSLRLALQSLTGGT
jgi:Flp pilus assembly protein TadD